MNSNFDESRDLTLLTNIEHQPDATQADLATQLGVAVGTVNWHIKRLISKGYVKVMRAERKKLRYIITPEGLAQRARLTVDYVDQQFLLYRRVRKKVKECVQQLKEEGCAGVQIQGDGDVTDICKLTCLEQNMPITNNPNHPTLEVKGMSVNLIAAVKNDNG